jgi:hypothetical protein
MRLTTLINEKPVRERMAMDLPRPKEIQLKAELLVPRMTQNPNLMGTAYDYLLRFHLQRDFPFATERAWLPEAAHEEISTEMLTTAGERLLDKLGRIIRRAKRSKAAFLAGKPLSRSLLQSTIQLAHCDMSCRAGMIDVRLVRPSAGQVNELARLIEATDWSRLRAKRRCLLNPTFGQNCPVRADADLLLDDMLIELKTTAKLQVTAPHWRQLIGYAALNEHFPFDGSEQPVSIRRVGFYFSRYGYLASWPLTELVDLVKFAAFAAWLRDYATERCEAQLEAERIAEQREQQDRTRRAKRRKQPRQRHPKVKGKPTGRRIATKKTDKRSQ